MRATVVVVGSANLDLVVGVPRLPAAGETVLGGDAVRTPGGTGANQAVAAARLGARTTLFAALGDDPAGVEVRAGLAQTPVEVVHVTTVDGRPTGVALIVVDERGDNTVTVAPGANRDLVVASDALVAALEPGAALLLQLEIPVETALAAARVARRSGARVILNASPIPDALDGLRELLTMVDVLVVNETEARALVAGATIDDLARALGDLGPPAVVVTAGARGAVLAEGTAVAHQPPADVDAVDPTGAGDAFTAALAVALADGATLPDAVRIGGAAGALATTRVGAQAALPTAAELARFLETGEADS